jgi:hypothetical protein
MANANGPSAEEERAVAALRRLAAANRLRVGADSEGFPIIPGRYGQIEWFDGKGWAVYSDHPKVFEKLWAIPGVRRWQTGDQEMRALFPPEALEQVAGVIRARRRRQPNAGSFSGPGSDTVSGARSPGNSPGRGRVAATRLSPPQAILNRSPPRSRLRTRSLPGGVGLRLSSGGEIERPAKPQATSGRIQVEPTQITEFRDLESGQMRGNENPRRRGQRAGTGFLPEDDECLRLSAPWFKIPGADHDPDMTTEHEATLGPQRSRRSKSLLILKSKMNLVARSSGVSRHGPAPTRLLTEW